MAFAFRYDVYLDVSSEEEEVTRIISKRNDQTYFKELQEVFSLCIGCLSVDTALGTLPLLQEIAAADLISELSKKKTVKSARGYWGMVRGAVLILRLGFGIIRAAKEAQKSIVLDLVARDFGM